MKLRNKNGHTYTLTNVLTKSRNYNDERCDEYILEVVADGSRGGPQRTSGMYFCDFAGHPTSFQTAVLSVAKETNIGMYTTLLNYCSDEAKFMEL